MLSKIHVECLIHGNIVKSEGLNMANMVEKKLISSIKNISPLHVQEMLVYRQFELPKGEYQKKILFIYKVFMKN